MKFYSVELLENNKITIQPNIEIVKHGALGRVIFMCNEQTAIQIKNENN